MEIATIIKHFVLLSTIVCGTLVLIFLFRTIKDRDKISFHSNCLIEAIYAKLENPKVKITVVPRGGRGMPHFLWSDGEYDYSFGTNKGISRLQTLWFKGKIYKRALGFNEKYKRMSRCKHDK